MSLSNAIERVDRCKWCLGEDCDTGTGDNYDVEYNIFIAHCGGPEATGDTDFDQNYGITSTDRENYAMNWNLWWSGSKWEPTQDWVSTPSSVLREFAQFLQQLSNQILPDLTPEKKLENIKALLGNWQKLVMKGQNQIQSKGQ